MKDYNEYTFNDFINDDYFIEWILRPTSENEMFWRKVINRYPEKESDIKLAFSILRSFATESQKMNIKETDELWNKIRKSTISVQRRITNFYRYAAAIVILCILIGGGWLYKKYSSSLLEINYSLVQAPEGAENDVSLFLADNSELKIQDKESTVLYNQNGNVVINSSRQVTQPVKKTTESKLLLNQIIVPFGKRTNVIFSDGTKAWINSGSRAIFPVEFETGKREVYIEGEAYFEVTKDQNKPFIVKTEKIEIEVLGTSFNVNSYADEKNISTVLASGSIKINAENKKEFKILPNQQLIYSRNTKEIILKEVNIYDYISWKEGWLNCNSEEIVSVVKKLARYYNREFIFQDQAVKNMHFSGKLELKEDFELVLRVFTLAAPLVFEEKNGVFYIKLNIK